MSRLLIGLALVSLGHLVYVAGSLDPITASTVFDLITAVLLGVSAWSIARGAAEGEGLPRVLLLTFVMIGVVKPIDYLLSLSDGWQPFHVGWTLVAIGGILLAVGAIGLLRLPGYRTAERMRWIRWGAWASAAGSMDYAILAALGVAGGTSGSATFLLGALCAAVGWATLALAPAGANAFEAEGALA